MGAAGSRSDIFNIPKKNIFADSQYSALSQSQKLIHDKDVTGYWAYRGLDTSPFENPANFASRETKYSAGLHDQSASLLNHLYPLFSADEQKGGQVHHKKDGAHFAFLPISEEEDQEVLYNLTRCPKYVKLQLPNFYSMVRNYRAEMTRLKLAGEKDLGVGFVAVPVANPGVGSAYKLRYGMKSAGSYAARKLAARRFKQILNRKEGPYKNEIVIAVRKHEGRFPIYALRVGQELQCYTIKITATVGGVTKEMQPTGKKISIMGEMT